MTLRNTLNATLGAALCLALTACGGEGTDGTTSGADTLDTVAQQTGDGGLMKVGGKLFNIPSPVETALLIKKSGLAYQKEKPLGTDQAGKLTGKVAQSLALGMYGADMAYVTIHGDGQRALSTLQAIEKLGNALEVSNAFDRALIDRYRNNLTNEDSLLRMSGDAFRAADQYLKTNERDDVSALVLAGGWIESMYLTLSGGALNDQLATRVGEQKRTLRDLVALIQESDKDNACTSLVAALTELQGLIDHVGTSYQFEQPVTDEAGMITHINSLSTVTITAEQVKAITGKINDLRSTILA